VFLDLSGTQVTLDDDALVGMVLSVAEGKAQKGDVAAFLRRHGKRP
jgi:prophage maintenance system killer protein